MAQSEFSLLGQLRLEGSSEERIVGWTDWNYFTADAVTGQEADTEGSGSH